MAIPKNYHQQTNLPKMIEALNDLNFYTVEFEFKFNNDFKNLDTFNDYVGEFGEIREHLDSETNTGIKKFSALNDDLANDKITEWLDNKIDQNVITEYSVIEIVSDSFYDVLKEKELLPFVNEEVFNDVLRKSI